jgi:hypothetical protein
MRVYEVFTDIEFDIDIGDYKTVIRYTLYPEYISDSYHQINSLHNIGYYLNSSHMNSIVMDIDYKFRGLESTLIEYRDTIISDLRDNKINYILDESL